MKDTVKNHGYLFIKSNGYYRLTPRVEDILRNPSKRLSTLISKLGGKWN